MAAFIILCMIVLAVLFIALWFSAIVSVIKSDFENDNYKILWILLLFIFPLVSSIVYFAIREQITIGPEYSEFA